MDRTPTNRSSEFQHRENMVRHQLGFTADCIQESVMRKQWGDLPLRVGRPSRNQILIAQLLSCHPLRHVFHLTIRV